jgi:hypothetical protein
MSGWEGIAEVAMRVGSEGQVRGRESLRLSNLPHHPHKATTSSSR